MTDEKRVCARGFEVEIDCFRETVLGSDLGMNATYGLRMLNTDHELRYGRVSWRVFEKVIDERIPIYYPAGKPLKTDAEIRRWRNKQSGSYWIRKSIPPHHPSMLKEDGYEEGGPLVHKEVNWVFTSFIQAYNFATGKPAKVIGGITIHRDDA